MNVSLHQHIQSYSYDHQKIKNGKTEIENQDCSLRLILSHLLNGGLSISMVIWRKIIVFEMEVRFEAVH